MGYCWTRGKNRPILMQRNMIDFDHFHTPTLMSSFFVSALLTQFLSKTFLLRYKNFSRTKPDNQWHPELMHFCPDVPFILVGTKLDMRGDASELDKLRSQGQSPITTEQGADLAKKLKAVKYMECSAKTQENLKDVFDEAIRCFLKPQKKKKGCILL